MSAAEDGRTVVTNRAEPAPNPAGQEANTANPTTKDFDATADTLPSKARGDGGSAPILHQEAIDAEQPRGWFRMLPDGSYEIGKTKIDDLSTFVHEPAHGYFKIISDLATREGASDTVKSDYAKIQDFLGAKELNRSRRAAGEVGSGE